MRAVVDASAFVDAILPTERQSAALSAMAHAELWAPTILDMEVASALWRLVRADQISEQEADDGLHALRTAPVQRVDSPAIVGEAWRLRRSIRIPDAFYVATARLLDATLITSDARLSRAPQPGVTVMLLG